MTNAHPSPEELAEVVGLLDLIGWKPPTLAEKIGVTMHVAYEIKAGRRMLPPADLDWLRRLAAAYEVVPRMVPTAAEPSLYEIVEEAFIVIPPFPPIRRPAPFPENDMDPNFVLTTLLDVYDADPESAGAISEALSRLGLLDQARAIRRQRAAEKTGSPAEAPTRDPFPPEA